MLADPAIPAREKNASLIPAAHKKITACERDLAAATAARKGLRASTATSCAPARRRPCSAPACGSCSSSCGCSRPTPSSTSPTTSTSTCTTTTNTGPSPARPSCAASADHHLHRRRDHRHPGPAQPAQNRPRPGLPPRRDQHQAAGHPRRPPAHHLPARDLTIINKSRAPNCWRSESYLAQMLAGYRQGLTGEPLQPVEDLEAALAEANDPTGAARCWDASPGRSPSGIVTLRT